MIHPIGGGSYGEVWLARSLTGSYRAIKVVWRDDFELERTFEREFEGIKKFEPISRSHPGLVHILHVGRNDEQGFYYYVMELADGQGELAEVDPDLYVPNTLRMEMNFHGRVPIKKTLDFGVSIAEALAHLHSHGLSPGHQTVEHHLRRRRGEAGGHRIGRRKRAAHVCRHGGLCPAGGTGIDPRRHLQPRHGAL
ncbi:MAG: hypothetical protein R3F11_05980 [Verrucomicrobiales bacterium]